MQSRLWHIEHLALPQQDAGHPSSSFYSIKPRSSLHTSRLSTVPQLGHVQVFMWLMPRMHEIHFAPFKKLWNDHCQEVQTNSAASLGFKVVRNGFRPFTVFAAWDGIQYELRRCWRYAAASQRRIWALTKRVKGKPVQTCCLESLRSPGLNMGGYGHCLKAGGLFLVGF